MPRAGTPVSSCSTIAAEPALAITLPTTTLCATKLAAEHLIEEYAAAFGLATVVNRCGVIAGPWQMGKVDQGVLAYWMLAHHFGGRSSTSASAAAASRCATSCTSRPVDLIDLQLQDPSVWAGVVVNVGGGRRALGLSLLEMTELCREITGKSSGRRAPQARAARRRPALRRATAGGSSRSPTGGPSDRARRYSPTSASGSRRTRTISGGSIDEGDARSDRHRLRRASSAPNRSRTSCDAGFDVVGIENDMRAALLRPVRVDGAERTAPAPHHVRERVPLARARHPRRRRRSTPSSRSTRRARARHAHGGAAVTRLGGQRSAHRLHRQRDRHAQPARGDAPAQPRRDVHLHLDQQGLRRPPELPAARRARDPLELPSRSPLLRRDRHDRCRSTAACTRCSARRRPRPTCSCRSTAATSTCRRSASAAAASPGPNHAGAQLHGFLSYLMRCTVTGDAVHGLRLRRQAGARQHPQRRPRRARSPRSTRARAPAPSTTSAAAARATARCSRRSRSASRSPARELDWELGRTRRASATTAGGSATSSAFRRDYPDWARRYDVEAILQGDPRANVERWTAVAG